MLPDRYNPPMIRTRVWSEPDAFDKLKDPWKDLIGDSEATPFQTWEWNATWHRHLGLGKRPHLVGFYEGNDLLGLLPLVHHLAPWPCYRLAATGPSDVLGPIIRNGHESPIGAEMLEWIAAQRALIDLHQIRGNSSWKAQLGQGIEQADCLLLDLPKTYDGYLQTLSKSLRYDCRRLEKKQFADEGYRLEEVSGDRVAEGLDSLFEVHRRRWRQRGLPGAFLGKRVPFQQDWARQADQKGWLWLTLLHHHDRCVGGIYAMRMGNTCYFYQAGFDPGSKSVSPGTVLVAYTIRRAIADGIDVFDFMRGDEPYKRRWKPQREVPNWRFMLGQGGILTRIGANWNRTAFRAELRIRARIEGKGLIGS